MQEIRWGVVQQVDPSVSVRMAGDSDDAPIAVKCASYPASVGDKVLLARAGSVDGWVVVCPLSDATVGGLQSGKVSGTTSGSGEFSVTFPTAYAVAPIVKLTPETGAWRAAVLRSVSTTGFTGALYSEAAGTITLVASGVFNVHWQAIEGNS